MGVFKGNGQAIIMQPGNSSEVVWSPNFASEKNAQFAKVRGRIAEHVARVTDEYVPMLQGTLKNSVQTASDWEAGQIVYNTIYARYQYYLHDLGHTYQGKRGPHWGERSVSDHRSDIDDTARKAAKEYVK